MSGKIVQLDFLPKQKQTIEEFQEQVVGSYRAAFAEIGKLKKELEKFRHHCEEVEGVVFCMHKRVDNLSEEVFKHG